MSLPRPVFPDRVLFVSRRCSERRFFLRPGPKTNQAFTYCLAEAANRFDIHVMHVHAMSNHYHVVFYDPDGNYPRFIEHFHKMLAKVMNCLWGRWEAMWASEQTSVIDLVDPADAFDKAIYTEANAVAAHLVARATEWPGVSSLRHHLNGTTMKAKRPHWFFDKNGDMPEEVELVLYRPPGYEDMPQQEWAALLRDKIAEEERKAAADREESGTSIAGRKAVLRQCPFDSPATSEPRRGMKPRVAAKSKWHRIEALRRLKGFLEKYRGALADWRAGIRDVLFPAGTYLMHVRHLVRCAAPPS